jgi:asparagine synthase (glutamine-hydrolysing)
LDSSTVAALAASEEPMAAYSAVFPNHPGMDEAHLIDRTARGLGIESTRIVVRTGSVLRGAIAYTRSWQVPPTSPNLFFWTPLLERAAADGIELMLDGEGGDELFAFSPFLLADRLRQARLIAALRLARCWPGEARPPSPELVWYRLREAGIKALLPPAAHHLSRRRGLDRYAPAWLPRALAAQWLDSEDSAFAWKSIPGPRWWSYVVYLVTCGAGPSAVYEQARRRCQLAGIEPRHPLVDIDVIDVALRLDPELAFDRRFNRPMLREAIAGWVPDEVRLRRGKSNFDSLFHQLLAGRELSAVKRLLDPRAARLGAYVDVASLYYELLDGDPRSHPEGLGLWAIRVWRLATAELWLRHREDSELPARLDWELDLPAQEHTFEVWRPG